MPYDFGAIWESCIEILKANLRKLLGRALITYDELCALSMTETIITDRPLTYLSGDLQEPEALTPLSFIL